MRVSETGIPGVWVRRYRSGRFKYGYTIVWGGRTHRRVSKVNSVRGAAAERSKALERLASGQPLDLKPERQPYTIAEAVDDYLKASENMRSLATARLHGRNLTAVLGKLPVSGLSQAAIAEFRRRRTENGVCAATVNRALSFLRAALNHAKGEGRFSGDHYFDRLSRADRKKVFVEEAPSAGLRRITDAQFESVVHHLPHFCRAAARLLLATAARKGEILGLRWDEVRGDHLYLRRTKSGKPRSVPLSPESSALLPSRAADARDDDVVFRGEDGGEPRNNFDRAWRAARERVGLPWMRVHDLRHEAASRFLEAGGTPRELQVLGGWSGLALVERYSKVDQDRIRETLAKLGRRAAQCTVTTPRIM